VAKRLVSLRTLGLRCKMGNTWRSSGLQQKKRFHMPIVVETIGSYIKETYNEKLS